MTAKLIPGEDDYSAEYVTWHNMKRRCYNNKSSNYQWYGALGIKVCDEWLCPDTGFVTFFYDMGRRPYGMSLDRIDSFGDYTPDNCRWADSKTQALNKRPHDRTMALTVFGKTQTIKQWSSQTGLSTRQIRGRIRRKTPEADIFFVGNLTPKRNRQRHNKTV